jgi:hypothetical protein
MEEPVKHRCVIGVLLAALAIPGSARLSAQENGLGNQTVSFIPSGDTVYDVVNHITWLADANLADQTPSGNPTFLFGLKLCDLADLTDPPVPPVSCVNPTGSMTYPSAVAWVAGMNAYQDPNFSHVGYLGHSAWQLPTAPLKDSSPTCPGKGPSPYRESFAFGCTEGALGFLYYDALVLTAPNSAIPIPPNKVGPFTNLQPNLYWSGSGGGGNACPDPHANFSFASGAHGGGCGGDYADVLPMIKGELRGSLPICCRGLYVYPGGQAVYDIDTDRTWLADANLAANWLPETDEGEFDTLGMPLCTTAPETTPCVALDGSMNYESAEQLIKNMNHYDNGAGKLPGYLGQTNWQLPPLKASCPTYGPTSGCDDDSNPLGNLYYDQLHFTAGTPVVPVPDIAVGPFNNLQPFPYWECLADTIQDACEIGDQYPHTPGKNSEWGFSFGTGFLGTERFTANHYVTAYYVGCDPAESWCQAIAFAPIPVTEVALSSLALSATATSGLSVSFTSMTSKVCTVSGNTASLLRSGTCTIEASQAGNDSFVSALPVQQTFTVNHAEQKITFPAIPAQEVGAVVHLRATASSGLEVTFTGVAPLVVSPSYIVPVCIVGGDTADMLKVGNCAITAHQAGNDVYAPAPAVERIVGVE